MRTILHSQQASPDNVLVHLSTNLKRLRRQQRMSQEALALQAGLSRRIISSIEGGGANVSLSTVDKLAAVLQAKFTDLVRPPDQTDALHIDSVGWRGTVEGSEGVLLGAAPGSRETELWHWSLAPGERYPSEDGSENWHEMLWITEGTLTLELSDGACQLRAGEFRIFSSAVRYTFANETDLPVRYVRAIVL